MNRIEDCIAEYKSWCAKLGIVTISDINRLVAAGQTDWLVNVSEIWQEQKISEIAMKIRLNLERKKLVLISGPSSSGKTSFAKRLQLHLKVLGVNAVSISLDDYYYRRDQMPLNEEGKPDFESLESINYPLFNENVAKMMTGAETSLPAFDFQTGQPVPDARRVVLGADEVIIVEGIHGLNDKLSQEIAGDRKYRIYCSALNALQWDSGERIKSSVTRLCRRLIRDANFRNATYSYTLDLWPDVERGAEKNIYPYTDGADIIFNSALLYELAAYRTPMEILLAKEPCPERHRAQVAEIEKLLFSFTPIDSHRSPRTSLVREFTGGSTLAV